MVAALMLALIVAAPAGAAAPHSASSASRNPNLAW
jgi:hypothetical protein